MGCRSGMTRGIQSSMAAWLSAAAGAFLAVNGLSVFALSWFFLAFMSCLFFRLCLVDFQRDRSGVPIQRRKFDSGSPFTRFQLRKDPRNRPILLVVRSQRQIPLNHGQLSPNLLQLDPLERWHPLAYTRTQGWVPVSAVLVATIV